MDTKLLFKLFFSMTSPFKLMIVTELLCKRNKLDAVSLYLMSIMGLAAI